MRVLALSDEESKYYYDYYTPGMLDEFDLIVACGDLRPGYLDFIASMARCPLVCVPGNHDAWYQKEPPGGWIDADGKLVKVKGLRIVGLGGSIRYREGPNQYTERQMARRARRLRRALRKAGGFDLLLAHSPARGLNDLDSPTHKGFECFNKLLDAYRPSCFVHGHVHSSYAVHVPQFCQHNGTLVVNACGHAAFELGVRSEKSGVIS